MTYRECWNELGFWPALIGNKFHKPNTLAADTLAFFDYFRREELDGFRVSGISAPIPGQKIRGTQGMCGTPVTSCTNTSGPASVLTTLIVRR